MMYSRSMAASVASAASSVSGLQFSQGSTELATRRKDDRPFNEVLELTHIPGPGPAHEDRHSVRRNRFHRSVHFPGVLPGEVPGEHGYILGVIAQRRSRDRK